MHIVEDLPQGYPRYSALMSSDNAFYVFRRFSFLRARLLLLKQDRLTILEKRLKEVDAAETVPLFLGASREDENTERRQVLDEIDIALSDYGCSTFEAHCLWCLTYQQTTSEKEHPRY